ncbi:cyclophilin-like fold protein [Raineyella fluvialis]|uniref:Cyclophilin-like domain-containing protein n=1 Tax=Raineyella fluvialis TaxID=2662261 RepID=A0A5Q2F824_9ACTN|nr:cyclophilin-like fold protein [Raineyella fluvialis]QGF23120.1 hypothetical protein Rai3103_04950 [Raineyella fluvialis]
MAPTEHGRTTRIRVRAEGVVLLGRLDDNPAARALVEQLPVTLTFRHFNAAELISPLHRPLPMAGMPAGADPSPQDIGYYAPSRDLVFYYGDVGFWNGIAILGSFESDLAALAHHDGDVTATVELMQ